MTCGNPRPLAAEDTNVPVVPVAGPEPSPAGDSGVPAADQKHWEFRLTDDRRRILVLVK
jgi:hypothetical protein